MDEGDFSNTEVPNHGIILIGEFGSAGTLLQLPDDQRVRVQLGDGNVLCCAG